jgi:hypothetical protein
MQRPNEKGLDVILRLQADLDREEARRRRRLRVWFVAAALVVVVAVAAVVLSQGDAAAADRADSTPSARRGSSAGAATMSRSVMRATTGAQEVARGARAELAARSVAAETSVVAQATAKAPPVVLEAQRLSIAIGSNGYEPSVVRASSDRPLVLSVGRGEGCAAGFLIPKLGVDSDNSTGPVTVDLGRVPTGEYQFSCGMEMVTGTLIVR